MLWKLDRLGRDLRDLVNTVEELRTRGVGLKVLVGAGAQIDTTTANGRLRTSPAPAFAKAAGATAARKTSVPNSDTSEIRCAARRTACVRSDESIAGQQLAVAP